jgi:hypothetical protein
MKTATLNSQYESFNAYLDKCKGEVSSSKAEGYYHVNVVADAYKQGFSDGKQTGEKEFMKLLIKGEIEKFSMKATKIYSLSKEAIALYKKTGVKVKQNLFNLTSRIYFNFRSFSFS